MGTNFFPLIISIGVAVAIYSVIYTIGKVIESREEERVEKKIEDIRKKAEHDIQKGEVKYYWEIAQVTLDEYFKKNLRQITWIFWLSVFVISVGFIIIIWGVIQAVQRPDVSIELATISSVVGVITEFIGATFLFIYRSTMQQASDYSKALERLSTVGISLNILEANLKLIQGVTDEKEKSKLFSDYLATRSKISESLVYEVYGKIVDHEE